MTNEIWVPKGTEVLTTDGWEKVEKVVRLTFDLMAPNLSTGKLVRQKVTSPKTMKYNGDISYIRADGLFIRFKEAAIIAKEEFLMGLDSIPDVGYNYKQEKYSGMLYSFQTKTTTAIFRNPLQGINAVDTLLPSEELSQDDYEDGGFEDPDNVESFSTSLRHHRLREELEPDYWVSHTRW